LGLICFKKEKEKERYVFNSGGAHDDDEIASAMN
jgi:hypothetical protein